MAAPKPTMEERKTLQAMWLQVVELWKASKTARSDRERGRWPRLQDMLDDWLPPKEHPQNVDEIKTVGPIDALASDFQSPPRRRLRHPAPDRVAPIRRRS